MQQLKKETAGQNLYGILTSTELHEYLHSINVDNFIRSPSAQQAMLDLMDSCHHATAGTGLDAFINWASQAESLRNKFRDIRDRWNRITPDHGLTAHYLARELRLHGNLDLEAKLANYRPTTINMTLRSMITKVREPMDAHRVIDELAKMDGLHPYQVNTVLTKLAKKTGQKVGILHDLYDGAIQANARQGVPWPHYTVSRSGIVKLQPTYENFKHLLKKYHINIQYNLLLDTVDIVWPDMQRSQYHINNQENYAELLSRCAQTELKITAPTIRQYVNRYAHEPGQEYHPIRAWLEAKTWDGLDRWSPYLAQLELFNITPDAAQAVLRRWFFKALDCLYEPKGVRKSFLLVLIGPSGSGKTLFLHSLLPEDQADQWLGLGMHWPAKDKTFYHEWQRLTNSRWLIEITNLRWRDLCDPSRFRDYLSRNMDRYIYNRWQKMEKSRYRRTIFLANITTDKNISKAPPEDIYLALPMRRFTPDDHLDMHQFWAQLLSEYQQCTT